jgi:hypothetical protein
VGARRGPPAAAAAARLRRRQAPSPDNKRHVQVLWGLGKGHRRLLGRGKQRGCSSTAAVRMARWAGMSARGGAKRAAFIGGCLACDVAVTVEIPS